MISASALKRDCGYPRVLDKMAPTDAKGRARRASRDVSAARGSIFHAAVQAWIEGQPSEPVDDSEIAGWLDLLASKWAPPAGTRCEVAWGLGGDGTYIEVEEAEPHVYRPVVRADGLDLETAGRADAAWGGHDGLLYVVDWKAGKWPVAPASVNLQVNAAGSALGWAASAPGYVPGIYYARDGVFDWGDPVLYGTSAHLDIFEAVIRAARLDDEPRPGDHCAKCWERRACTFAQAEVEA